ncbi:HEPN domain-containing protein [Pseudaeromonas pectinilytica]
MAVSSKDFLDFAIDVLNRTDEIGYRNAIARAYYAMFHEVTSMMTSMPVYSAHAHDGLIQYLNNAGGKTESYSQAELRGLAAILRQQKGKRVLSDYDLQGNITSADARESIKTAERLFAKCNQMKT